MLFFFQAVFQIHHVVQYPYDFYIMCRYLSIKNNVPVYFITIEVICNCCIRFSNCWLAGNELTGINQMKIIFVCLVF